MPARYYYRRGDREFGPVRFAELVALVRGGELCADDLVRGEWEPLWRTAAEREGLFYLARRADVVSGSERATGDAAAPLVEEPEAHAEQATWRPSMPDVPMAREQLPVLSATKECEDRVAGHDSASGARPEKIQAAIDAAAEELKHREGRRKRSLPRLPAGLALSLPRVLRAGLSVAAACAALMVLSRWSATESLRFPSRDGPRAGRVLPWLGESSPLEYTVILADVALIAGGVGYGVARWLETVSDE